MSQPLVSVVMSVYNEQDFLAETVDSILSQTFRDFEFIIVDDGSTDATAEILNKFSKVDRRIKIVSLTKNAGIARATNQGVRGAEGKYIAIMDSGDIAHPRRLEKQVAFLMANEDVVILGTQGRWIDEGGRTIGRWWLPLRIDGEALFRTGGAIHPSIMVRSELFHKIGLYDESLVVSQEFDLYMRALVAGLGIANLEEELICLRERGGGMTLRHLKMIQKNQLKIKAKYLPRFIGAWSIIYTLRSLVGYALPSAVLSRVVRSARRIRND
jgi:glycosyltransferase involved in cell wall biosynthesis